MLKIRLGTFKPKIPSEFADFRLCRDVIELREWWKAKQMISANIFLTQENYT
jgi:hypothetical protein